MRRSPVSSGIAGEDISGAAREQSLSKVDPYGRRFRVREINTACGNTSTARLGGHIYRLLGITGDYKVLPADMAQTKEDIPPSYGL